MARTFVTRDDLTARAEIRAADVTDYGTWEVFCVGCGRVLDDPAEHDCVEDAIAAAETHVDRCKRCADDTCRAPRPHDAGHRCRTSYLSTWPDPDARPTY